MARTAGADQFCSQSAWGLAHCQAFLPRARPSVVVGQNAALALAQSPLPSGTSLWHPLEAMWLFGSSLVGDEREAAELFFDVTHGTERAVISGIPVSSPLLRLLGERSGIAIAIAAVTDRCVVDLEGGPDTYLRSRSANFRRSLARAQKRTTRAGITIERVQPSSPAEVENLLARVRRVEEATWKGRSGVGIATDPMWAFYCRLLQMLGDSALAWLASQGDLLLGYYLGGRAGRTLRGLQFGYHEDHAELGLGNALQWQVLEYCWQNDLLVYDLGSDMNYKRRWQTRTHSTYTLAVRLR